MAGRRPCVVLITNAPRTAEAVEQQLVRIGLPRECWDAIATSGEAGIDALEALHKPVGFIGTAGDREILEGRGVRLAEDDAFTELACTGLEERGPMSRIIVRTSNAGPRRRPDALPQP